MEADGRLVTVRCGSKGGLDDSLLLLELNVVKINLLNIIELTVND